MSFDYSVEDLAELGDLAWKVYKECKSASAEFHVVRNEVVSLHTAIHELYDEAADKTSTLNHVEFERKQELIGLLRNSAGFLRQIEQQLTLSRSPETKHKRNRDHAQVGSDKIQEIRDTLASHTSALTLFLKSTETGFYRRIVKKIDDMAVGSGVGQNGPLLAMIFDGDDQSKQDDKWRALQSELSKDFSRDDIEAYKEDITRYVQCLWALGNLEEQHPSSKSSTIEHQERVLSPASRTPEDPFMATLPDHTPWPPQPTCESDSESTGSIHMDSFVKNPIPSKSSDAKAKFGEMDGNNNDISTSNTSPKTELPLPQKRCLSTIDDLFPPFDATESIPGRWGYVGVDINFDYCHVAAYDLSTSTPVVLSNEHGNRSTPTYIAFTENDVLIGEDAKQQASRNVENTFYGFTRLLGSLYDDKITATLKNNSTFQVDNRNGKPAFYAPCRGRHYSPEELSAFLIKKMVRVAEVAIGQAVPEVLISTHAPLSAFRREAFSEAAALAKVVLGQRLRNSTTAAAFKYLSDQRREDSEDEKTLLVVDARIEGCDCSVFVLGNGIIEVLGTFGHFYSDLSLDISLSKLVYSEFHASHPELVSPPPSREVVRLTRAVEEARRQLMSAKTAAINIDLFMKRINLNAQVQQTQLEEMVKTYLLPTIRDCYERLFRHTKQEKITDFILIGEMARIPYVRSIIKQLSWDMFAATTLVSQIDPLECAVLGITVDHENTHRGRTDKLLQDCTNSCLSIATHSTHDLSERMTTIFRLGTWEPNRRKQTLFTMKDHQEGVLLRFFATKEFEVEEYRQYFEVAFSLPSELQQRGSHTLTLTIGCGSAGSSLDIAVHGKRSSDSQDDDESSKVLLEMCRSSTGLVTVKRGKCMPITPNIRENWRVTVDEVARSVNQRAMPGKGEKKCASSAQPPRRPSPPTSLPKGIRKKRTSQGKEKKAAVRR